MDRTSFGRRLALLSTTAMLVALGLQLVANPHVVVRPVSFLHQDGERPWAVAVYAIPPGDRLDLIIQGLTVGDVTLLVVEAEDAQAAVEGKPVHTYEVRPASSSEVSVRRLASADPDGGLAVVWRAPSTLTLQEQNEFARTAEQIETFDCCLYAMTGSDAGEIEQLVSWTLGASSFSAIIVGLVLWRPWLARGADASSGPADLVALFSRVRMYVGEVRRASRFLLLLLGLLLASAVLLAWSVLATLERRANIPIFVWAFVGILAVFVVPAIGAWRLWRNADREHIRLEALDAKGPL